MYRYEELQKYDYFKDLDFDFVLDSLTGVVSRGYINGFAQHLIEIGQEFSYAIMDIDNFKLVNDNYGHSVGDECLKTLGADLVKVVGDRGVIGRFGGDEFVIIFLEKNSYDKCHDFLASVYGDGGAIRKTMCLSSVHIFVTATTGMASFPADAKNYDNLFEKADKALYRGKMKGRNCYIIYVEEKHKNIDVHKRGNLTGPMIYEKIDNILNSKNPQDTNYKIAVDYIAETLGVPEVLVYFPETKTIIDHINLERTEFKSLSNRDFELFFENNQRVYSSSGSVETKRKSPSINRYMTERKVQSILVVKFETIKGYGYVLCYENQIVRIWQDKDICNVRYLSKAIALDLYKHKLS